MSDTLIEEQTEEETVTPSDGLAHYVKVRALLAGGPVTALCGKRYVPVTAIVHDKQTCLKCVEAMSWLERMNQ